jgi:hypothetical protein
MSNKADLELDGTDAPGPLTRQSAATQIAMAHTVRAPLGRDED